MFAIIVACCFILYYSLSMIVLAPPTIKRNQITDLKYRDFIEVTYAQSIDESVAVSSFDDVEKSLLDLVKSEKLHHLRIHFPVEWVTRYRNM